MKSKEKKKRYYLPTIEIDKQLDTALARELEKNFELKTAMVVRMALRKYLNIK